MECTVKIKMDNAAFVDDPSETARILREAAAKCEHNGLNGLEHSLRDINGNKVGSLIVA